MSFDSSRAEFVSLASERPTVVRTVASIDADVEPLAAYAALTGRTGNAPDGAYSFLLESAEKVASSDPDGAFTRTSGERHARFSFVGYDPAAVVTVGPEEASAEILDDRYAGLVEPGDGDTLDSLRGAMPEVCLRGFPDRDRQHLDGGLVGFVSYDAVYDLWLDEHGRDRPDSRFPDAQFVLDTRTLAFDHARGTLSLVFTPVVRECDDAGELYADLRREADRVAGLLTGDTAVDPGGFRRTGEEAGARAAYERAVERAGEHVADGDVYQAVVSRTRELYGDVDPVGLYEALRDVNPSPYMYLLGYGDRTIVGASPETLVSVGDRDIVANPIAGTCERGASPVEDRRLAGEMLADDKERAEHTMLVDLARNDVRRVAEPGSVGVEEFMNVRKYSHVQHIESTITGTLAPDRDAFDAVRATLPAGTLSGAPKIRAMEIIDDLEAEPRGPYGGGVGYVSWRGDADFAIVIRTATIQRLGADSREGSRRITVRAGAGVVADSDPGSEYEETETKMEGVLTALERIEPADSGGGEDGAGERTDGDGAPGGPPGTKAPTDPTEVGR